MTEPVLKTKLVKNRKALIEQGITNVSGCYGFFKGGTCIYIGMSKHLLSRIMSHASSCSGEIELWIWHGEDRKFLEDLLIQIYQPTNNIIINYSGWEVMVERDAFTLSKGTIMGQSIDKTCWRINFDGHGKNTIYTINKNKCQLL